MHPCWGGVATKHITVGGLLPTDEQQKYINYLEKKAVFLGLQSLCTTSSNCHIKVLTDNITTFAYIRNMEGTRSSLLCSNMAHTYQVLMF